MPPIERTCRDCHQRFTVTDNEVAGLKRWAAEAGKHFFMPSVCFPCRKAKRRAQRTAVVADAPAVTIMCADCLRPFRWGGPDSYEARFFAQRGRPAPLGATRAGNAARSVSP
jgi:hypothetical protein